MKLPAIFSDGMVLEKNARIWGTADTGETIAVNFLGKSYEAAVNAEGRWELTVTADSFGGPYEIEIGNRVIKDVMVGYVWLCGGQSNMELPIARVRRKFEEELRNANYPGIRAFNVRKAYDFEKEAALYEGEGEWKAAVGENTNSFFATAYFFARKLWDKYGIPIGLVCSAAGGSTAEAWISEEALGCFPKYINLLNECKTPGFVAETERRDTNNMMQWHRELNDRDEGVSGGWQNEDFDDSLWAERELTEGWERDLNFNGSVWFRKDIEVPPEMTGQPATLFLGRVVDSDYVYVNGTFVGRIEYRYPPSIFELAPGILREGRNSIAVRVISNNETGGFVKDKPYKIVSGSKEIDLTGLWKYKVGCVMPPLPPAEFFFKKPAGLYNAMLSPVIGYSITGAIWYQGESNAHYPDDYGEIMRVLIADWRKKWGKDFPFIFTQLVNYEAKSAPYPESNWAELREKQLQCLDIQNTAMAVGIDCGEYNDLHPLDKKTLGERLALAAFKLAYGEDVVMSGPIVSRAVLGSDAIRICFEYAENGLKSSSGGNSLAGFEIKGDDGKVRSVKAEIEEDIVAIDISGIDGSIESVRYAWADNPIASLYNAEGLPASPFRFGGFNV